MHAAWRALVAGLRVRIVLLLALVSTTSSALAQDACEAGLPCLTLEQARSLARDHHPRLAAARSRLHAAVQGVDVAAASWLPQVGSTAQLLASTANSSTATVLSPSTLDLPRIGGTSVDRSPGMQPYPSTLIAVGVRQQLFDFGRVHAEQAAAQLLAEAERQDRASSQLDVDLGVTMAYYAVLSARGVLAASRAARERSSRHTELARAGVKAGLRATIELARAEADLARFELGELRAEGGLRVAQTVLAAACALEAQLADAAELAPSLTPLPALDALYARVQGRDPAVRAADARAGAELARAESLDADRLPRLHATASVSGRAGGAAGADGSTARADGWLPSVPNWNVGAVLSWSMYEPIGKRRAEALRTRARGMQWDARALERDRRAGVGTAYEDARVASHAIDAVQRAADAARVHYEHAEQRFRSGLGSSLELSDAESLRVDAEVQLALARTQAAQLRARLDRLTSSEGP